MFANNFVQVFSWLRTKNVLHVLLREICQEMRIIWFQKNWPFWLSWAYSFLEPNVSHVQGSSPGKGQKKVFSVIRHRQRLFAISKGNHFLLVTTMAVFHFNFIMFQLRPLMLRHLTPLNKSFLPFLKEEFRNLHNPETMMPRFNTCRLLLGHAMCFTGWHTENVNFPSIIYLYSG